MGRHQAIMFYRVAAADTPRGSPLASIAGEEASTI
jgi:hypothetical protein